MICHIRRGCVSFLGAMGAIVALAVFCPASCRADAQENAAGRRNLVLILSDDHRYDFLGFMDGPDFLETPGMDRMANRGAHLQNAFVSTSLCSPSRATILTGQSPAIRPISSPTTP